MRATIQKPAVRATQSDVPAAAHAKAVAALDEFDTLTTQYVALLDTQRALMESGNPTGVAESAVRGDMLAARAAACGHRLAPMREALAGGAMRGPRADALRARLERMSNRVALLVAGAAEVAGRCQAARDVSSAALAAMQRSAGSGISGVLTYGAPSAPLALALDTRG